MALCIVDIAADGTEEARHYFEATPEGAKEITPTVQLKAEEPEVIYPNPSILASVLKPDFEVFEARALKNAVTPEELDDLIGLEIDALETTTPTVEVTVATKKLAEIIVFKKPELLVIAPAPAKAVSEPVAPLTVPAPVVIEAPTSSAPQTAADAFLASLPPTSCCPKCHETKATVLFGTRLMNSKEVKAGKAPKFRRQSYCQSCR